MVLLFGMDQATSSSGVVCLIHLLIWLQTSDAELFIVGVGHPRSESFIEIYTTTSISNLETYSLISEKFNYNFQSASVPADATIIVTALKDGHNVYGFLDLPTSQPYVYQDDSIKLEGRHGVVLQKDGNNVDFFGSSGVLKDSCKIGESHYMDCPYDDGWARRKDGVIGKFTISIN